jgi:RNA polymerase sigma factor (sigma-70 family)
LAIAPALKSVINGAMESAMTATAEPSELARLMAALAGGDRAALATLYQRTSAKLYGICLRLIGDEAEAQDVLQEVYVTAWGKAAQYDPAKASPITWLAVLARNKAIDQLRRRKLPYDDLDAAAAVADDRPLAFDIIDSDNDRRRLAGCLDTLDERPRAMIRSAFLEGATYPELAEREGVPLGTMKSWIRRGLMRLKGCLEQ